MDAVRAGTVTAASAAAASSMAAKTGTVPSVRIRQAGASGKIDCTAVGLSPTSAAICLAAAHSAGPRPVSPSSPLE